MMDGRTWGHVECHACKAGHARGRNECVLRILTSTCSAYCYDPLQALGSMLRSVDKVPCVQGLFRPGATLGALESAHQDKSYLVLTAGYLRACRQEELEDLEKQLAALST